jgi:receptor protein-tyrosine kinase
MGVIEDAAKRLEGMRKTANAFVQPVSLGSGDEAVHQEFERADNEGRGRRSFVTRVDRTSSPGAQAKGVSIDLLRLGQMGLIAPNEPRSQMAEEFRSIKRPLIRNAQGKSAGAIRNGNLIMVTSAVPGEGKSTCSVNLAISMAMELDSTVLLVDADVAKPSIPTLLGFEPERGLLDVVEDESLDLSDVLLKTNIDKLCLLPSGRLSPRATELLASQSMGQLLQEMSGRYSDRIVVFDSPPLLSTNEARALAAHIGQVVVVVEAESTTHAMLAQALAEIESCPVKLLLLNKDRTARKGGNYGDGRYGYGIGSERQPGRGD